MAGIPVSFDKPAVSLTSGGVTPHILPALPLPAAYKASAESFNKTSPNISTWDRTTLPIPITIAKASSSSTLPATTTTPAPLHFPGALPPNVTPSPTGRSSSLPATRQHKPDKRRINVYAIYVTIFLLSLVLMLVSYAMPLSHPSNSKNSNGSPTPPGHVTPVQRSVLTIIFVVLAVLPVIWALGILVKNVLMGLLGIEVLWTMDAGRPGMSTTTTEPMTREKVQDLEAGNGSSLGEKGEGVGLGLRP